MYRWMKTLHTYSGLLSYAAFTVWGIVGIWASFLPPIGERRPGEPEVRSIEFQVDGSATDQEVADAMIVASGLPFIEPGRRPRRDPEGRLEVAYYTPNGSRRIVLLEDEGRIRVDRVPAGLGQFLNAMHMQTIRRHNPGWIVHVWGFYNEFSLWAVAFMTLSGAYMWLTTRPGLGWAWWILGLASVAVTALVVVLG